jgi:hypothetical protein
MKLKCMLGGLMLLCGVTTAMADADAAPVEGYYVLKDIKCAAKSGKRSPTCAAPSQSCLKLANKSGSTIHMELFNPQGSGHVCGINGVAKVSGNTLRYVDQDAEKRDWVLDLSFQGSTVNFTYVNPPEGPSPFCGEHARLNGLTFKLIRQKSAAKTCFEG